MSRPPKLALPMREGVSASALACPPGPWPLLLDFLAERLDLVERSDWAQRMAAGEVLGPQGQVLPPDSPYRAGQRIYYYRQLAHETPIPFDEILVHVDEHLVVADKPHFLPVTPKGRYVQQTLLTRLKRRLGLQDLTPVHRLDRETAGLTVFCVQAAHRDAYQRLFRERGVDKVYEAVAAAPPPGLALPLRYRSRLAERPGDAFMQMCEVDGEPNAETEIRCLRLLPGGLAHYELHPLTGQKHQLRAQMCALGLPLLGDRIYPRLQPPREDFEQPLQLLARAIAFDDPVSGMRRRFESGRQLGALPTSSAAAGAAAPAHGLDAGR